MRIANDPEGKPWTKKSIAENLDFVENSNFVRRSIEAGSSLYSGVNSQENTCGGALF